MSGELGVAAALVSPLAIAAALAVYKALMRNGPRQGGWR